MAEMFNVMVLGKGATSVLLQYNSAEDADEARMHIESAMHGGTTVSVEDNYGIKALLRGEDFAAVIMTHLSRNLDGQRVAGVIQEIAKAKLQQDLVADPVLKFHSQPPKFRGNPQFGG